MVAYGSATFGMVSDQVAMRGYWRFRTGATFS
jgi:hypothetical protein